MTLSAAQSTALVAAIALRAGNDPENFSPSMQNIVEGVGDFVLDSLLVEPKDSIESFEKNPLAIGGFSSPTDITLGTSDFEQRGITRDGPEYTVQKNALYRVSYSCRIDAPTSSDSMKIIGSVRKNTTVIPSPSTSHTGVLFDGAVLRVYNSLVHSFIIRLVASDKLKFQVSVEPTGTVDMIDAHFSILEVSP